MKKFIMLSSVLAFGLCAFVAQAELNPMIPFLAITGRPSDAEIAHKVAALKADGFD